MNYLLLIQIGYINKYRLQQNHPCVIELIRRHHLKKPSSPDTPYKLEHPEVTDQSAVQTGVVLEHLRNKVIFMLNQIILNLLVNLTNC